MAKTQSYKGFINEYFSGKHYTLEEALDAWQGIRAYASEKKFKIADETLFVIDFMKEFHKAFNPTTRRK